MYILPGGLAPLAAYRQFVLVQFVPNAEGGTTKWPINPTTMQRHDAHDPSIWSSLADASILADTAGNGYGVGFVLTANDPFICLDLDKCTTPQGDWIPEVSTMLAAFPGAAELSNSGQGLHVWATYRSAAPEHKKKSKGTLDRKWLELYSELRFIALGSTVTGQMQDVTDILPGFIAQYFPPNDAVAGGPVGWTEAPVPEYTALDDDEMLSLAMSKPRRQDAAGVFGGAAFLPSFRDLWTRDVAALSQKWPSTTGKEFDGSEADFALAKELAYWTGKDCERIRRLMLTSGLRRDKWDVRTHRTYLVDTVMNAVAVCQAVYSRALPTLYVAPATVAGGLAPRVINENRFIGREDMARLFAGCVYVQDLNAILLPNGDVVDQPRFKARYAGYTFAMDNENNKVTKDAWEAFIYNSVIEFPRVEGTSFLPGRPFQSVVERAGRSWVNIYKEPPFERRAGDCSLFLALLHKLLPNGDDALIMLSYMAAVVQHKGRKFKWAPFVQGTQGNGKSTLVACVRYALGDKYSVTVKANMIVSGFNSWMENNILYVADDFYTGSGRDDLLEALKSLITESSQSVQPKGIDVMEKRVCGNFIFTDNHKDAQRKRDESRRTCTLYCAQQSKRDRIRDGLTEEFFARTMYPWLEGGGYAHVAEMLLTMPIDPRYNPAGYCQEAPETSVTAEAIIDGRTGVEHEVDEWITLEQPGFCGDFVSVHMLKQRLEATPRFSKSATPLKIKEMLGRLGYEIHPALERGRVPMEVQPDSTRPILYVKRDSAGAALLDPVAVGMAYETAQQRAMATAVAKRFQHGATI